MIIPAGQIREAVVDGRALTRGARPVVQNLGPGDLYIGSTYTKNKDIQVDANGNHYASEATALKEHGLKLPEGCVYELPTALVEGLMDLYMLADVANCDVRILLVG